MKICKFAKRLQIYLDGWMEEKESTEFERHLRKCDQCQNELVALEEVSSAALEIVDEAPEPDYWSNFHSRVMNRVIARNASPYSQPEQTEKRSKRKMGTYSVGILSIAAAVLLLLFVSGQLTVKNQDNLNSDLISQSQPDPELNVAPVSVVDSEAEDNIETTEEITNLEPTVEAQIKNISYADVQPQNRAILADDGENNSPQIDMGSYLAGEFAYNELPLQLAERNVKLDNYSRNIDDRIDDKYRLKTDVIADGILSYADQQVVSQRSSLQTGSTYSVPLPERLLAGNIGVNTKWGYLSMPGDSSMTEEFQRFLIEIELIEIK